MRHSYVLAVFAAVAFAQSPATDQRIADLTEVINRKPDFAAAYYARGVTYLSAGQYWIAEADLTKAIELRPDAAAYASRADVYTASKRVDQAIADLTSAIALKPAETNYYLRRANSYRAKGACGQAIEDYSEVIRRSPAEEAFRGRSACRKQMGDASGADEDDRVIANMAASRAAPRPAPSTPSANPPGVPNNGPGIAAPAGRVGTGGGIGSSTGGGVGFKPPVSTPSPENVYRIGGGVSQPSVLFKVEPEYSEEARKAKWQGSVTLSIVVNQFGEAQNFKVVRPLGLGLDEQAIEAVQKWVFKPGRKDGQPVAVFATIEVTFHLL